MAAYWPSSFCVFKDRDEVKVNKNAKKNEANIQPSCMAENFFLRDRRREILGGKAHLARSRIQPLSAKFSSLPHGVETRNIQ